MKTNLVNTTETEVEYLLYCKRLPPKEPMDDNCAGGDWVYCGVRGWHDSADKFCPEPEKLTERELRRLYLMLPVGRHYYAINNYDC